MEIRFSVYFSAKGAGVLNIKAMCGILSSEIFVTDAIFYDNATPYNSNQWIQEGASIQVSSSTEGTMVKATQANSTVILKYNLTISDFVAELDLKIKRAGYLYFGTQSLLIAQNDGMSGRITINDDTWYHMKIECHDGTVKTYFFEDNEWVLKLTTNISVTTGKLGFGTYQGATFGDKETWFKNLIVTPI